jgi:hypothetical protein
VSTQSGPVVSYLDLTIDEYVACRDPHDAFTATTNFATPPLSPPPGDRDQDLACNLPSPGSATSGVACSGSAPGLVFDGTDYAGGGITPDPNVIGNACVAEVGQIYTDNACSPPPELSRRSACDSALATPACQSCDSSGSIGACTSCKTELENRFSAVCLGAGFPVCQ